MGKEAIGLHSARLMAALAKLKVSTWPYPGAIGIVERDDFTGQEAVHVVEGWRHLGTARDEAELAEILAAGATVSFDMDTYKLIKAHLKKASTAVRVL